MAAASRPEARLPRARAAWGNLRQRMVEIGDRFEQSSRLGQGSRTLLVVPLPAGPAEN